MALLSKCCIPKSEWYIHVCSIIRFDFIRAARLPETGRAWAAIAAVKILELM